MIQQVDEGRDRSGLPNELEMLEAESSEIRQRIFDRIAEARVDRERLEKRTKGQSSALRAMLGAIADGLRGFPSEAGRHEFSEQGAAEALELDLLRRQDWVRQAADALLATGFDVPDAWLGVERFGVESRCLQQPDRWAVEWGAPDRAGLERAYREIDIALRRMMHGGGIGEGPWEGAWDSRGTGQGGEAEPDRDGEAPKTKPGVTWQEAEEQLEHIRAAGEEWTSCKDMSDRIGCSTSTIQRVKERTESEQLKAWAGSKSPKARQGRFTEVVRDQNPSGRERDPVDIAGERDLTQEQIDDAMNLLIQQATPEDRAKLHEKDEDERRSMAWRYLEQKPETRRV